MWVFAAWNDEISIVEAAGTLPGGRPVPAVGKQETRPGRWLPVWGQSGKVCRFRLFRGRKPSSCGEDKKRLWFLFPVPSGRNDFL